MLFTEQNVKSLTIIIHLFKSFHRDLFPHYLTIVCNLLKVALFCACMGGMMYYLEHEPDTMSPFLRSLIRRFLASRISNPGPTSTRNPSYNYLHTLDAIKKPNSQNQEPESQSSEKYNLESIPGL